MVEHNEHNSHERWVRPIRPTGEDLLRQALDGWLDRMGLPEEGRQVYHAEAQNLISEYKMSRGNSDGALEEQGDM